MTDSFLPKDYKVPVTSSGYMKWQNGDNIFRILASPVIGNEYWTIKEGKRHPIRKHMGENIDLSEIAPDQKGGAGKVAHFWAMPIFDYADSKIKILEITQKTIQKAIKELASDTDWGSPTGYDISVSKAVNGDLTEYGIMPKPAKPLDKAIKALYDQVVEKGFNLEALFTDGNPFSSSPTSVERLGHEVFTEEENTFTDDDLPHPDEEGQM